MFHTKPNQLKSDVPNKICLPRKLKDSLVSSRYSCHAVGCTSSYKGNICVTKCTLYKYAVFTATCFNIHMPPSASVHPYILNLKHIIQYIRIHSRMIVHECQNISEKIEHIYIIRAVLCGWWFCKWKIFWISSPHYTDWAILPTQQTTDIQNHDISSQIWRYKHWRPRSTNGGECEGFQNVSFQIHDADDNPRSLIWGW